jgi:hypothetical protein
VVPEGAHALPELMERLRKAPRRRDFKTVPMILDRPDLWDDTALKEVIAYRDTRKQVWDNTDIGSPWMNLMQFAQCAGVLFRAWRLPDCFGHARLRSPRAFRPGYVGQIQARRDGRSGYRTRGWATRAAGYRAAISCHGRNGRSRGRRSETTAPGTTADTTDTRPHHAGIGADPFRYHVLESARAIVFEWCGATRAGIAIIPRRATVRC